MKQRLLVLGSLLLTMVAFQNCSKAGFESALNEDEGLSTAVVTDMKVVENGSLVAPDRTVSPVSIQFGQDLWIGVVDHTMSADPASLTVARRDQFAFDLNIRSGTVISNESGQTVLQLDPSLRQELLSILKGSIIARLTDFPLSPNAGNYACPEIFQEGYARLVTRSEDFMLGEGSPCGARDLYRQEGGTAGLRAFLDRLQQMIDGTTVPVAKNLVSIEYVREFGTFQVGAQFRRIQVIVKYQPVKDQYQAFASGFYSSGNAVENCETSFRGERALKLNKAAAQVRTTSGHGILIDSMPATLGLVFSDGSSLGGPIGYAAEGFTALTETTALVTMLSEATSCLAPVWTTN